MRILYLLPALFVLMTGCSISKTQPKNLSHWQDYTLFSSKEFVDEILRPDGSFAYTTYDSPSIHKNFDDFAVYVYPPTIKDCSPSVTGILPPSQKTVAGIGDKTVTGKTSISDLHWIYDIVPEDTACDRPTKNGGGYAFCSEKNGKTVLICISQQTDNPKMAEDIFNTFRWTD